MYIRRSIYAGFFAYLLSEVPFELRKSQEAFIVTEAWQKQNDAFNSVIISIYTKF